MVVVVLSVFIVVVPVPEVDIGRRLQEEEGYPHVDRQPRILVVVVFSPGPPSTAMIIFFPVVPPFPPSWRRKRKSKRDTRRKSRK